MNDEYADSKLHELYLELRIAVIQEFTEYQRATGIDCSELLSNVLLGMEKIFNQHQRH